MTDGPGHARWNTRYLSAAARAIYGAFEEAARRGQLTALKGKHMRGLRHEHVFPRRVMVDRLLAGDTLALTESFGCVVTVAEHGILDDRCSGWDRYREAGVGVWDRAGVGAWLDW